MVNYEILTLFKLNYGVGFLLAGVDIFAQYGDIVSSFFLQNFKKMHNIDFVLFRNAVAFIGADSPVLNAILFYKVFKNVQTCYRLKITWSFLN